MEEVRKNQQKVRFLLLKYLQCNCGERAVVQALLIENL